MENKENVMEIDLIQLVKVLWQRIWVIAVATIVCGALALSYAAFLITPKYEASALMYVNNSALSLGNTKVSLSDLSAAQSLVETYIVILKTRTTLEDVIERADLDYSYEQLRGMISAEPVDSTEVFAITVTSADPNEAEKIANTIANLLPEKISDIVEGSSVRIVDHAVVPSSKASPSLTRFAVIGLLLGAVLSCGVIILMELFDEQIRGEAYLRQTYDLPVLASIPDLVGGGEGSADGYYKDYSASGKEAAR